MDSDMFLLFLLIGVVAVFSGYILARIVLLRKQVNGKLDSLESCYDDLSGKVGLLEAKHQDMRNHLNKGVESSVDLWERHLSGQCEHESMCIDRYVSVYMQLNELTLDQLYAINRIRYKEKRKK